MAGARRSTGGSAARATACSPARPCRSTCPRPTPLRCPPPQVVEGLRVVHEDDDLVVVDKPVGVAAHPSPGWEGPDRHRWPRRRRPPGRPRRARRSARASCTASTSGRPGSWWSPRASGPTPCSRTRSAHRTVDKRYHTLVQGHPDPLVGTVDAPIDRHPTSAYSSPWWPTAGRASRTTRRSRRSGTRRCSRSTSRPGAPTRSACTWPRCATPASVTSPTAPTRRCPSGSACDRQWLHAVRLSFAHPDDGRWVSFESPYPADLQRALDRVSAAS